MHYQAETLQPNIHLRGPSEIILLIIAWNKVNMEIFLCGSFTTNSLTFQPLFHTTYNLLTLTQKLRYTHCGM